MKINVRSSIGGITFWAIYGGHYPLKTGPYLSCGLTFKADGQAQVNGRDTTYFPYHCFSHYCQHGRSKHEEMQDELNYLFHICISTTGSGPGWGRIDLWRKTTPEFFLRHKTSFINLLLIISNNLTNSESYIICHYHSHMKQNIIFMWDWLIL